MEARTLKHIALYLLLAMTASSGVTTTATAASPHAGPVDTASVGTAASESSDSMDAAVTLSIPDNIQVMAGDLGNVPITFAANGNPVTSLAFELHYDVTKLALKLGPNSGGFREVLSVSFANLPVTYKAGAFVATGVEGDVEFFMHIDPGLNPPPNPLPLIPNGVIATLTFTAIGASGTNTPLTFELANPAPSAGLSNGSSNPDGVTVDNGSIDIIPAVRNIALLAGWNLIGLNIIPTSPLPVNVFASIISVPASSSPLDTAFTFNFPAACAGAGAFRSYKPDRPINSLTSVNVTQGIWLLMRQDATLTVTGAFPLRPLPVHLCPGFNLIAYPSRNAANINPLASGALSSINGQFNSVFGEYNPLTDLFKSYVVGRPINPLTQMKGGVGYWIDATVETDLTIPDN